MSMSHSSSAARFTAARAWSFLRPSQLVVARSDRRLFRSATMAFEPELARVVEDGSGCEGLANQNDSGLPQGRADRSVLG
jgi:hypothetical protein